MFNQSYLWFERSSEKSPESVGTLLRWFEPKRRLPFSRLLPSFLPQPSCHGDSAEALLMHRGQRKRLVNKMHVLSKKGKGLLSDLDKQSVAKKLQ